MRIESRAEAVRDALAYMGLAPGTPLTAIRIDRVFIGSCTNARIEDLRAAAAVLAGRKSVVPGLVSPGSLVVKRQAEEEGLSQIFQDAGLEWVDSGCSMCVAMNGDSVPAGERCASTTNRNFKGRQGPGSRTHLMSPAMAAAAAVTGRLTDARDLLAGRRLRSHAMERFTTSGDEGDHAAARQYRHRSAHPRAFPQASALRRLRAAFCSMTSAGTPAARRATIRSTIRARGRGRAPDRAAQFWLRLVARRGGLCACGLWRPMRRSAELRRHFRLQRSEERPSAGAGLRGGRRGAFDVAALSLGEGAFTLTFSTQTIVAGNLVVSFAIDPVWKTQLLNGWDDVDLTLAEQARIDRFRAEDASTRPWATPRV